jgi:predicted DNA-binding transcriptional regulator AlpA
MDRNESSLMTVKEVAEMFKCSPSFVYKHYKKLSGFKIAGIIRFPKQNLEKLEKGDDNLSAQKEMDV